MSMGYLVLGLGGLALGVGCYYLSENEKRAKRSYKRQEREHSQTVVRCNRQIKQALISSQNKLKIKELKLLHSQSVLAADKVYAVIKNAKQALSGHHRVISEVMKQKAALKNNLDTIHGQMHQEVKQNIRVFNEILKQHYAEKDMLKKSIDDMYLKLDELNQNTGRLKLKLGNY